MAAGPGDRYEHRKSQGECQLTLKIAGCGLNIASQFAPEISSEQMMETVREALSENIQGKIVDLVNGEDQEHVEIYLE
jgi:hypothetical protein